MLSPLPKDRRVSPRRAAALYFLLALIFASGLAVAYSASGITAVVTAIVLMGAAATLAVSLTFLLIGESEDLYREEHPQG